MSNDDKQDEKPRFIGDEPVEGLTGDTFLELIEGEMEITITMYQAILIQNDMMRRVVRYASQRDNPEVDPIINEFNIENCGAVVDAINEAHFSATVRERLGLPRQSIPDDEGADNE